MMLLALTMMGCKKAASTPAAGDEPKTCTASKAALENISVFPSDNPWNTDISQQPTDLYNTQIISSLSNANLKADFGSGLWQGAPIGIPYTAVCGNEKKVNIVYRANQYDGNYGDESDPGPFPIPLAAAIEGGGIGDSHVIAVDQENEILYELYNASVNGDHWEASSGAVFDLRSNQLRKDGWTSADAAGLPIFPGLVRYDEIEKGEIDHAIRFTLNSQLIKPSYIFPARHKINGNGGLYGLPFGARIRLKAAFDISTYSATNQVILKALKKYGMILADAGSNLFISGAPDSRWNNDDLHALGNIRGSDFEVISFNQ